MRNLEGQTAIVSGGIGDIGRAIALELAQRGAQIALGDLHEAAGPPEFLDELHSCPVNFRYDRVDVSDSEEVTAWFDAVEATLGTPTLIIPNAAQVTRADCRTVTPKQWDRELQVNLNGAFYMAQTGALRLVSSKRPGRIVFIGSWAAHVPHPRIPAYSVGKAGLRMLCRCMALELAPYAILVNEVAPGYVDAGLSGQLFEQQPELRVQAERAVPIRSLIAPEEVALQVAHLCDPANRQMTGTVLLMDGGLSLVTPAAGDRHEKTEPDERD